jgi:hypothetical protein
MKFEENERKETNYGKQGGAGRQRYFQTKLLFFLPPLLLCPLTS